MTRVADVAVVGGGIIGLSVAWHAARRGDRVVVLERAEPMRFTSRAAAAMIAPVGYREAADDEFLRLRVDAQADWSRFAAELRDTTGVDPAYRRIGSVVAATDRAGWERVTDLRQVHAELGIDSELVDAGRVAELEPELRGAVGALHVPGEGCVDPDATGRALVAGIGAAGGEVRAGTGVADLSRSGDRVTGVRLADGTEVAAGTVVLASGATALELPGVPDAARFPLRAVKGQSLLLRDRPGAATVRHVVRAGINLVPRGDGRIMVAGTVEDDPAAGDALTPAGMRHVLSTALAAVPAVADLAVDGWCVGRRPVAGDDAPVLGPGTLDGLWWATGHSYYGILLSGLTGALVAAALRGDQAAADRVALFGADRFRAGTPRYTALSEHRHA